MQNIKKLFKCNVGFSDHTTGINASVYAAALGAELIEKHVVLNKKINTVDSFFSIDFRQFKEMVKIIRSNEKSLGKISYKIPISSLVNLTGRKSIFAYKQISKGEKFSKDNIKVVRPSYGLHPRYYKIILNKKSKKNLYPGDPLRLCYVKK